MFQLTGVCALEPLKRPESALLILPVCSSRQPRPVQRMTLATWVPNVEILETWNTDFTVLKVTLAFRAISGLTEPPSPP